MVRCWGVFCCFLVVVLRQYKITGLNRRFSCASPWFLAGMLKNLCYLSFFPLVFHSIECGRDTRCRQSSGPRSRIQKQSVISCPNESPEQIALGTGGTCYGSWTYNPRHLDSGSIIYSVGIGEDTSWDEHMIKTFGLHIWGFDPTPRAARYVRSNTNLKGNFTFIAEGLSKVSGWRDFDFPTNRRHVSLRESSNSSSSPKIRLKVNTLDKWMQRFGHSFLDVLKLDIEGSEYEVLNALILQKTLPFCQLLVEWHWRFKKNRKEHDALITHLERIGLRLVSEQNGGQEMTFLRCPANCSTKTVVDSSFFGI